MDQSNRSPLPWWIRQFPVFAGACVLAVAVAVLVGWAGDIPLLKSISPHFVAMKPNTALGLALLGGALLLTAWPDSQTAVTLRGACEGGGLVLGVATVAQYAFGVDLRIDQALWREPLGQFQTAAPGRMSIITAFCLAFAAVALLLSHYDTPRARIASRALATCVAIVGLLGLIGYLYGTPLLYRPFQASTAMAVHSAAALVLLAGGIVALNPHHGIPSIAAGKTLSGTQMRWVFPAAVLIPLLIGGIAVRMYEIYGVARASIALAAAGTTVAIGMVVAIVAMGMRRIEKDLEVTNRALAATSQGVFIADASHPAPGTIIYVNPAFTRLTGYSEKEAIGSNCELLTRGAPREAREAFERALAGDGDRLITLPCQRRDGTVFSGRFSITLAPALDGRRHIVGLLEDVTAEQLAAGARLELLAEASQARKDAEAANKAKDMFFASITHELRSPLNACLMWLDVLALGPQSDKSAKAVDAIKRNLKIQARLVNDLIDAAKISSGGIEIHRQPLEAESLIEGSIETWQMMASARQVEFLCHLPENRHVVYADPERLQQVLTNLLDNAFRNTPPGGRVSLEVAPGESTIAIHVVDTGTGLSAEDLARVFTPFWRVAGPKRDHKGLGLGLAIAQHLVRGHEGTLTAVSEGLGRGCRFTVTLPYARGTTRAAAELRRAERHGLDSGNGQ
jgi:PAS domain S-box-containing protein